MPHDPHVIKKQRDGGTRHGEVTYYAVGWQRDTRLEAREDLRRFLNAEQWDALLRSQRDRALAEGAGLRGALEQALSVIGRAARGSTEEERRADLLLWGAQLSVEASRLQKALVSSPLSKLAGALIRSALAAKDYLIPGTEGQGAKLGELARDIDALEAALARAAGRQEGGS